MLWRGVGKIFAGDSIHVICDLVTVCLGARFEGLFLREESSNDTIMSFVGTTLTGAVGVAIIDLGNDGG